MKKISELVLQKDHHIIAINKPYGLPSQQTKSSEANAHQMIMAYAHRDVFMVHRLDQRVSGVLLFAKTKEAAAGLSEQFKTNTARKIYFAIVPERDIPSSAELKQYLTYDNKNNLSTAHEHPMQGSDEAILKYRVVQHLENFMVLEIELITGRKHQIRAQLSSIGIPIRGDIKYGSKRTNENGAIDLHARSIEFIHPSRKQFMKIVAPFPDEGLWNHIPIVRT